MSKRKKKRGGGRSPYEGYETEVWGSSPIQIAAIEKEYRSMEEESFQMGAEDREQNRRKMDYHEFALDFAALPLPRGSLRRSHGRIMRHILTHTRARHSRRISFAKFFRWRAMRYDRKQKI